MMWFYLVITLLLVCAGYFSRRYAWWKTAVDYRNPRILMYHMISEPLPGGKFNSLRVPPAQFERQLDYLKRRGWTFFTMAELVAQQGKLPEKSVAITFDDGYEDNLTRALPLLKKYNAKATIYLVVDRHNREWSSKRKQKNADGELMREHKLSDEQVQELIDSGLIEIGSHTLTHDNLPTLENARKELEIAGSKKQLEQLFGIQCRSFCYPFGLYDDADVKLVEQAGYSNATTVDKGMDDWAEADLLRLKRITISGKDNFYSFLLKLKTGKRGVKK